MGIRGRYRISERGGGWGGGGGGGGRGPGNCYACIPLRFHCASTGIFEPTQTLKFASPHTQNLKFGLALTQNPNVSQWNIGCVV